MSKAGQIERPPKTYPEAAATHSFVTIKCS
jgi:hypothetical protein